MRSLVCALVMLVACNKPGGVEIEVDGAPDGVNYVRVYISTVQVANVPSLTVPDSTGAMVATTTSQVFARETDNSNDLYEYKAGESLNLEFETGDAPTLTSLPAVILVGFDGDGSDGTPLASTLLTDLPLDPHTVTQYKVELGPSGITANSAERLFLWSPDFATPPLDAACVGMVGPEKTAFIVTAGDTDCDGDPDGSTDPGTYECDPYVYKDMGAMASLADGMCFQPGDGSDTTDGACRLGADTCVDGAGPTAGKCNTAGNICMPTYDCTSCQGGAVTPLDCILAEAATTDTTGSAGNTINSPLAYACTIGTTIDSSQPCAITVPRPPTGGFACVPQGMNSETGIAVKGDGAFHDQVNLDGTTYMLDVTASCGITLTPSGSTGSAAAQTGLLLRLDLADPDGPSSLVLPIAVTFSSAACTSSACTPTGALGATALQTCAAGWGQPTDSRLAGSSPTLNAAMTEIFFIATNGSGAPVVETATRPTASDPWAAQTDVTLNLVNSPVFVHLGGNDSILYVVDSLPVIHRFMRAATTSSSPWMDMGSVLVPGVVGVNAYAPDSTGSDAIVATAGEELYEVDGSGISKGGDPLAGQTPFMTDDDLNLWYALQSDGDYTIYVSSRVSSDMPFTGGVPVELGSSGLSTVAEAPWVSSDLTTMFFASDQGSDQNPIHIYSVTR